MTALLNRTTAIAALLALASVAAPAAATVRLEDLTSPELRERIASGTATVLLPIGGTEQNGPHMTLGKHNRRVQLLAERIAERLGDAVVAPVLAYVPEGRIDPPTQHMRWPGTISVPATAFEAVLEAAARSLRRHGLCHVVLLGDHGGYRTSLNRVAARLDRGGACRTLALPEYYQASIGAAHGASGMAARADSNTTGHGGLTDTALMLALDPGSVRTGKLAAAASAPGVAGDPAGASAEIGRAEAEHVVAASVAAIRGALPARPAGRNDKLSRSPSR